MSEAKTAGGYIWRIKELEQENLELKAHVERLRNAALKMDEESRWFGDYLCLHFEKEGMDDALNETPAQSLAAHDRGPEHKGYTNNLEEAGWFTEADALQVQQAMPDKYVAIPVKPTSSTADFLNEIKLDITGLMDELFELGYTEDGTVGQKANAIRHKLIVRKCLSR